MRKALLGALTLGVATSLVAPWQASALNEVNTARLREAVTVNGILQHARQFQRIANDNDGTRASGTPGYDASARYVAGRLERAGYDVTLQEFTFPFFRDLAPAELSQLTPTARDFETFSFTYSGSGDVTGTVVPIDLTLPPTATPSSTSGCEAADFDPAPTGPAIALIQRGTCTFEIKATNAAAAGYDAVIIFNEGQEGRQELLTGTAGVPQAIPVVGLSFADGNALAADAEDGATARVFTSTESDPTRKTVNVIADSPEGRQDGTVVVGAHIDGITEGPGLNDNGSGAATTLEIAEQMAELGLTDRLQRQVRFAFWGAEELGLLGAEYYVDSLSEDELDGIYANLNFDMLGSTNYVRFVYDGDGSDTPTDGPPGSDVIEDVFTDYFAGRGLASEPTAFDGRSDYGPFIAAGIPAGGLFSGAEGVKTAQQAATYGGAADKPYDPCYHQACDDITNLSPKALNELGDAAAHATLTLTRSREGLFPDGSRLGSSARKSVALTQSGPADAR